MEDKDILAIFESTGALLRGHFELRSKLHSDQYFQCARVLCHPRIAGRLCEALAARVRAAPGGAPAADAVIAPALGGILVGHEIARALDLPSYFAEKENDKLAIRRFAVRPGQRFIVAEDVITRGGRVQETMDLVLAAGGRVAAVATLVDRSGGKVTFPCPTFSLLVMEPVTWQPEECPLCRRGVAMVHPGS